MPASGRVDLSLWETDKAACVAQVGAAARDTGFLQARAVLGCHGTRADCDVQVVNHGIPAELIDAAFAASATFFAQPDEVKALTPFAGWAGGWEKELQVQQREGSLT